MADPTFVAFIDESGCDGDKFGKGSTDFLILSAAVGCEAVACTIEDATEFMRDAAKKPDDWKPPKFEKANGPIRWGMCDHFTGVDFFAAHILIHKPSINDENLRNDRNRLYRYGSKLLIERISWICESLDHPHMPGDGLCRIIFSQDLSRSYELFRDYVTKLSNERDRHNNSVRWKHVDPGLIEDRKFGSAPGLLLADYHASSLGLAAERRTYGQYDDRYARMLGQKILKGPTQNPFGYGYKFWPREAERLYHTEHFSWMKRV